MWLCDNAQNGGGGAKIERFSGHGSSVISRPSWLAAAGTMRAQAINVHWPSLKLRLPAAWKEFVRWRPSMVTFSLHVRDRGRVAWRRQRPAPWTQQMWRSSGKTVLMHLMQLFEQSCRGLHCHRCRCRCSGFINVDHWQFDVNCHGEPV